MNLQKYLKFSLELLLKFWVVRMTPGGLICSTPSSKLRVPPSVPSYNNCLHIKGIVFHISYDPSDKITLKARKFEILN